MKAVIIERFGPPKVLEHKTVSLPNLSDSTILVKIKSAGVNPVDTYVRAGAFPNLPEPPFTPGKDGAGVVEKVGVNVTKFKAGQRVFICGKRLGKYGTYAEYSLVSENDLFILDDTLNFDEGAALGIPYFTAYRALVLKAKCVPGETILIHGASGAVGLASVQLAKKSGAIVIGTAGSSEGLELVKKSGADFVISHKEKNYLEKVLEITNNVGVNIIIEMLANLNLDKDLEILAPNGRVIIVGSRGSLTIDPRKMMIPETQVIGVALLSSTEDEWAETANAIISGIKEGWVKPAIDKKYPLAEAAQAHKDIIQSKGAKGKLVLTVQD